MAIELRHLRYFLAVAEELNVTRAAARLGISQPPLSQQIKELEYLVGAPLFHRTPQGVVLTEAGVAFRAEAHQIVSHTEHAKMTALRASRGETGQLRLGFTGSAAFNPVVPTTIRAFRRASPNVRLIIEESNTTRLLEGLVRNTLDAGFIRPGVSDPVGVRLHRFADERMKVALPTSHPLAARKKIPLAALAGEPFVLFPRSAGPSLYDAMMSACRDAGFEPQVAQEAPQMSSVVNLVAAELGISIVPASIEQLAVLGVCYVDIAGSAPYARLALAVRDDHKNPAAEKLIAKAAAGKRSA